MNFDELCDRLFNGHDDFWQSSHHAPRDEPFQVPRRSGSRLTLTESTSESSGSRAYLTRHSQSELATNPAEPDTALRTSPSTKTFVATRDTKSEKSSSRWWHLNLAGLFGGLLLAALLLVKGYQVEHAATRPIEDFRPGQRAIVDAPPETLAADVARLSGLAATWNAGDGSLDVEGVADPLRTLTDATPEQITRADYRLILLQATEVWPDGTVDEINVQTLQPWQWIQEYGVRVGGEAPLPLDAEEMGLEPGIRGQVLDILSCPEFEKGRGRIILTTVNHLNHDVRELTLRVPSGRTETLRPTGSHKFYSVSRGEWLSASELQSGEHLDGIEGRVTVVSSRTIPGTHRVYNFTVQGEHLYRVANCGVLVHNQDCIPNAQSSRFFRGGNNLKARLGVDVKPGADGLIHPFGKSGKPQGLSLNIDPKDPFIQKYGGAFPVKSVPDGLQILQSGKPGHFVVAPSRPMSFDEYQGLLSQIDLGNFNILP